MKFRKKPVVVDATQWFPGVTIIGVVEVTTKIHYSDDGSLYYVTRAGCRPTCWLSASPKDGPITPTEAATAGWFKQIGEFRTPDGRVYSRTKYDFNNTKVQDRNGRVEDLAEDSDLFLDYASTCEWLKKPTPEAFVTTIHGQRTMVTAGDWVITEPDGVHHYPCKPDIFAATYDPVDAI